MPRKTDIGTAQRQFDQEMKMARHDHNQRLKLAAMGERIRNLRENNSELRRSIRARNEALDFLRDEIARLKAIKS